jgi:isoleucyl-tRNA synthetase
MRWPKSLGKGALTFKKVRERLSPTSWQPNARPPAQGPRGYEFIVPLLDGDHVTDDAGTGFVHTAPGHGREDFDAWMSNAKELEARGIDTRIPFTVDDAALHRTRPGFEGARVITDNGKKGDANEAVIKALIERNALFARGRLKHSYPHSWRSKKPVIFRNTPQWFVYMDKDLKTARRCARRALNAIDDTRFVPAAGQNRLRAMIEQRPDWVLSRQRAWGVPICVFADEDGNVLQDEEVNARILEAFEWRAPMPGSPKAPRSVSSATATTMPSGPRSWTSSTSGSTVARHIRSRWKTART